MADPLMAASNVDLHSIVDEIMGTRERPGAAESDGSLSVPKPGPSRLRGGEAGESASLLSDYGAHVGMMATSDLGAGPSRIHAQSPTMSGGSTPDSANPRHHQRDWSINSETGLMAGMDNRRTSMNYTRRSSEANGSSSALWLPPGASPPNLHSSTPPVSFNRDISNNFTPPRLVTGHPTSAGITATPLATSNSPSSYSARGKAAEAAQERRSSLAVSNPSVYDDEEDALVGAHSPPSNTNANRSNTTSSGAAFSSRTLPSFTASSYRDRYTSTPFADDSEIDPRSVPPSLAHAWMLDTTQSHSGTDDGQSLLESIPPVPPVPPLHTIPSIPSLGRIREEIPPRYDMIRRDTSTSEGEREGEQR